MIDRSSATRPIPSLLWTVKTNLPVMVGMLVVVFATLFNHSWSGKNLDVIDQV